MTNLHEQLMTEEQLGNNWGYNVVGEVCDHVCLQVKQHLMEEKACMQYVCVRVWCVHACVCVA